MCDFSFFAVATVFPLAFSSSFNRIRRFDCHKWQRQQSEWWQPHWNRCFMSATTDFSSILCFDIGWSILRIYKLIISPNKEYKKITPNKAYSGLCHRFNGKLCAFVTANYNFSLFIPDFVSTFFILLIVCVVTSLCIIDALYVSQFLCVVSIASFCFGC